MIAILWEDIKVAGGILAIVEFLVMIIALAVYFHRYAAEYRRRRAWQERMERIERNIQYLEEQEERSAQ